MTLLIKDTDYLHATMRVRALERRLLDKERRERLLDAKTSQEAFKVLSECGYDEVSGDTPEDWERALSAERRKVFALLDSLCPDRRMVDVFRIRYDYHNLKVLLKTEMTGEDPARLLIDEGRMPAGEMLEAVRGLRFTALPGDMKSGAVEEARELLARTGDPQQADFLLDRLCAGEMTKAARDSGSAFLMGYVRLSIDWSNLRAVVRTARLGREPDFLRVALCPGGNVEQGRLETALQAGKSLEEIFSGGTLAAAAAAGQLAQRGEGAMTVFERMGDNALLMYLSASRATAFGEQPLLGYLAARESELTTVRTVLSGRSAGLGADAIRERLREGYV